MEYHVQFGTLSSKRAAAAASRGQAFRIGLLGDFSGKGNVGRVDAGDSLASRKPLRVTHENLDAILERLDVNLNLPAGASGAMISVPIKCLDDFHPDQLFSNVPLFEKLVSLRQKLQDPSTFPKAAAAVRSLAVESGMPPPLSSRSSSSVVPRRRIDSFADLMNQEARTYEAPELKTLLRFRIF